MQKYNFFQKYQIKFTTFSKLYMRFFTTFPQNHTYFYNFFQFSDPVFTTFSVFCCKDTGFIFVTRCLHMVADLSLSKQLFKIYTFKY